MYETINFQEKGLSLFEDTQQPENSATECDGGNTSASNEENAGSTLTSGWLKA